MVANSNTNNSSNSTTAEFRGVSITPSGNIEVGDTLRAVPSGSSNNTYSYRWYWASSNIGVNDRGWSSLSGETYSTYRIGSARDGDYIMCEVTDGYTTYRAKSSRVGSRTSSTDRQTAARAYARDEENHLYRGNACRTRRAFYYFLDCRQL